MASVLSLSVVLIGLLLGAFIVVAQVKKRLVRPDETSAMGFTLSDLRALHRDGKMTDAEFEKAKQIILASAAKTSPNSPREPLRKTPSDEIDGPIS